MLSIYPILCRAGIMDNYAYLIVDEASQTSAVIDPSEAAPIIAKCNELNIKPQYILNTHHHFDHTDGNLALKEIYNCQIVGNIKDSHRIPGFDIGVEEGKTFALGASIAEIIDVSAHTQGHILWYFPLLPFVALFSRQPEERQRRRSRVLRGRSGSISF